MQERGMDWLLTRIMSNLTSPSSAAAQEKDAGLLRMQLAQVEQARAEEKSRFLQKMEVAIVKSTEPLESKIRTLEKRIAKLRTQAQIVPSNTHSSKSTGANSLLPPPNRKKLASMGKKRTAKRKRNAKESANRKHKKPKFIPKQSEQTNNTSDSLFGFEFPSYETN